MRLSIRIRSSTAMAGEQRSDGPAGAEQALAEVLAAIHTQVQAGAHEEARAYLLALLAQHPQDARLQYETACAHDRLGLEREAVPCYQEAIRLGLAGDELRGAYLGLGSTLRALGQYAESAAVFAVGLARFPDAAELQVFLAMTNYNLAEHHAAVAALLRVIAATTSDPATQGYARAIRCYAEDLDRTWG
jgi:tetratricopeptide (TPR) repeat protein